MDNTQYISRCLQLARLGAGHVAPNPMVGAVVVCGDEIIGEGYHQQFGGLHAEPNAIHAVHDKERLRQSTLYVSLEPCSHYGKTPPCAELIIRCCIPRVVIGTLDPNPRVAGRGVRMLQEAGVEVAVGCLETECRELNKHFFTFHEQHRPYVTLKWAQTADGFIDHIRTSADTPPLRISNAQTTLLTHKMRAEHQAILVGGGTVVADNPTLTVRHWHGRNPMRLIIDRSGRTPDTAQVLDGNVPTIVYTATQAMNQRDHVEFVHTDFNAPDALRHILQDIYERNINSVLVEGGAQMLGLFISQGLWDEARVEVSPVTIGRGIAAPTLPVLPHAMQEHEGHAFLHYTNTKA